MSETPHSDPPVESAEPEPRVSTEKSQEPPSAPAKKEAATSNGPESPEVPTEREPKAKETTAFDEPPESKKELEPGEEPPAPKKKKKTAKKKAASRKKAKKDPPKKKKARPVENSEEPEKKAPPEGTNPDEPAEDVKKAGSESPRPKVTAEESPSPRRHRKNRRSRKWDRETDPARQRTGKRESDEKTEGSPEAEKEGISEEKPPPRETKAERNRRRRERRREQREKEREREAALLAAAPAMEMEGLVEISPKGFGFLRQRERSYQQAPDDVFITPEIVRIHGLRDGVWVKCLSKQGSRGPQLVELLEINGKEPTAYHNLPYFEELTAINPNKRLALETKPDRLTTRVIDMMTPIGRGQRGLIVAPPRTGKTTFLHHIAEGILENYEDEVHCMVMLIDERPEEVTDFRRSFPNADVFASSNDADVKSHTRMAQLAIERAKRLVEAGEHVFILLDSITRLARAFNSAVSGGKKRGTQSGGIAVGALEIPRKLFAAARNTREAGSLTIIATALIQTNSKMDEAIFQEFKGTGNMELVLDRQLAQNYVYPAVDINRSGTRREELLIPGHMLEKIHVIRRGIAGYKSIDAMEWLIKAMERYQSNAQMLMEIRTSAVA